MFFKKDNLVLGLILGFLAPLLGLLGFYFTKFSTAKFLDFLYFLTYYKSLFTSVISVSLIINAIIFTLYINTQKDKTARGVFAATCVYAIICIIMKFLV
jgi:zinc transporter ZupT